MSDSAPAAPLPAFAGYGVEIEYMIVDRERLDVRPLADRLLQEANGNAASEVDRGLMGWSNEMMLHVIEIKNNAPVASLDGLAEAFHGEVRAINALLDNHNAQLLPTAMHPWMNPRREARLWTVDHAAIYRSYDRIFDCRRHGWANLQSMHLNLPFAGDDEFARLHAAIRLVLPILPALAASSPWVDGKSSGYMDYRLALYRDHQREIPSSMGQCIPEPVASAAQYEAQVFAPMYRELLTFNELLGADADVLRNEWLDARAAVPRFARSAIEIRLLDVQECPRADLAIAAATSALVRRIYEAPAQAPLPTAALVAILDDCIRSAEKATISDADYLARLGYGKTASTAGGLWQWLIASLADDGSLAAHWLPPLEFIAAHGPLARRLCRALGDDPGRLHPVYRELCDCLQENTMFAATRRRAPAGGQRR